MAGEWRPEWGGTDTRSGHNGLWPVPSVFDPVGPHQDCHPGRPEQSLKVASHECIFGTMEYIHWHADVHS